MLGIYEHLLSLTFTRLEDADKWHDDVQVVSGKKYRYHPHICCNIQKQLLEPYEKIPA
jgi:hypothetical protein